ncbi:MAG: hypothetical protein EXR79_11045 [Myxococcales bacterium]|nr:hypothetical protein [Myxococcales bacterium]
MAASTASRGPGCGDGNVAAPRQRTQDTQCPIALPSHRLAAAPEPPVSRPRSSLRPPKALVNTRLRLVERIAAAQPSHCARTSPADSVRRASRRPRQRLQFVDPVPLRAGFVVWRGEVVGRSANRHDVVGVGPQPEVRQAAFDMRLVVDCGDDLAGDFTCAATAAGKALCWGLNDNGQCNVPAVRYNPAPPG